MEKPDVPSKPTMRVETGGEQLLFTTVRIETTDSSNRRGTGTAFIFNYSWDSKEATFLVTNKHVIKGAVNGQFFFTASNGQQPLIGERRDLICQGAFEQQWHGHPNDNIDIAVSPMKPLLKSLVEQAGLVFYKSIPHTIIPSQKQMERLDVIEEVTFIGYPSGIFDTKNLMPITRKGTTATPPMLDYKGEPIFLIDASVFPGSSGSPVFIYNPSAHTERGMFNIAPRVLFLGILAQAHIRQENGRIEFIKVPTHIVPIARTPQMIDLGVVYKSSAVLETVLDFLAKCGVIEPEQ